MHEQWLDNNLAMSDSESIVHNVNQNSSHILKTTTIVDIKSLTKTNDNQSEANDNSSTLLAQTVEHCEKNFITSSRHVFEKTTTTATVVMSQREDTAKTNKNFVVDSDLKTMSHKNFTLPFDPSPPSQCTLGVSSETMLSPAEVPFGRRYAEISQFKNHPNIEWLVKVIILSFCLVSFFFSFAKDYSKN